MTSSSLDRRVSNSSLSSAVSCPSLIFRIASACASDSPNRSCSRSAAEARSLDFRMMRITSSISWSAKSRPSTTCSSLSAFSRSCRDLRTTTSRR